MAYAPPQKDVFGNWKQPKGKEVVLQDETPTKDETHEKNETPIKDETPSKDETPAKDETPVKDETPTKDETPSKNETPSVETPTESETPIKDETPTKDETPAIQPSQTEESWKTVREKPRKSRNSGTVEMEGRKKAPTLPKLNYKKIIQKSLKPAEPIPAVITGPIPPAAPATSASPASPASSAAQAAQAAPSSNPPNETPKTESKLINETPRTESKPSNETPSLTSFLSSLPPLQDTLPTDETPSQDYETPFHRFPAGISYNLDFDYGQAYGFGSFDASMAPYPYYYNTPDPLSYPFQSSFPPKTHYGEWREREMDLERDSWFLPMREDYRDVRNEYFGHSNNNNNGMNYSNEELQVREDGGK